MTRTRLPVRMGNLVFGGVFIVAGSVFLTFLIWAAAESVRLRLQPAIGFRVVQTEIVPVTALGVLPVRDWVRSRDWVSTPATIEMSRTTVSRSSKGNSYHPEVLYHYAWKGELHRSSRIGVGVGTKESESGTRRFVAAHPVGSTTTCLVNPEDPTESLLDCSLSWWSLLAVPFCAFPVLGLMLLRAAWQHVGGRGGRCQ
jgi:hypothetical protein